MLVISRQKLKMRLAGLRESFERWGFRHFYLSHAALPPSSGVQLSSVLGRFRLSDEDSAGKRAEESGSSFSIE
jgi:hypothetical protein